LADGFDKILVDAASQKCGVAVICHSADMADKLRRLLYVRRAKAQKEDERVYDNLSLSFSPHAGDILYIHKKEAPDG
jgi:hypothetical protein